MKIRPNYPGTILAESDGLVLFLLFTSSHDCLWWDNVNGYALVLRALNDAPAFFERFGTAEQVQRFCPLQQVDARRRAANGSPPLTALRLLSRHEIFR
jgi:hypothetical protein